VKNLSKFLSTWVLLLVFSGCNDDHKPRYQDFDEDDFILVPGIVTKITRTPIYARGSWYQYNVYYAYNLESEIILEGKEMDVDLALKEGDGTYVLVHKREKGVSFVTGSQLLPKDQKILESYLKKSKENGVKYYGLEEQ
jgi:hypothetical protein